MGGYSSVLNGGNFWDGATNGALWGGASGLVQRLSIGNKNEIVHVGGDENNGQVYKSQGELNADINTQIGDLGKIKEQFNTDIKLANENNLPKNYTLQNSSIRNIRGNYFVDGITQNSGGYLTKLRSTIFLAPEIKGVFSNGVNITQSVIGHELIHALHKSIGNITTDNLFTEKSAYNYSYQYALTNNMSANRIAFYFQGSGWYEMV